MKKENKKNFYPAVILLVSFILWTILVRFVDVKPIGPRNSAVGFATLNEFFHRLTCVNMTLYTITDWLGLVPVFFAIGFGILGLIQWIKRKNILKVDFSILILGGFYIAVISLYLLFETVIINYRPTLINGYLEASYPSSTTMLVMCVIPTAVLQFEQRIKNKFINRFVKYILISFTLFMVIARLISGVHWLTDIIGGIFISAGLVMLYRFIVNAHTTK